MRTQTYPKSKNGEIPFFHQEGNRCFINIPACNTESKTRMPRCLK